MQRFGDQVARRESLPLSGAAPGVAAPQHSTLQRSPKPAAAGLRRMDAQTTLFTEVLHRVARDVARRFPESNERDVNESIRLFNLIRESGRLDELLTYVWISRLPIILLYISHGLTNKHRNTHAFATIGKIGHYTFKNNYNKVKDVLIDLGVKPPLLSTRTPPAFGFQRTSHDRFLRH